MANRSVLYLLLMIAGFGGQTLAADIIVQPGPVDGKDAWVRSGFPDVNSGDDTNLYFGASPTFDEERHLYIEFDLTNVPPGTTVLDAWLEIYMWGQNGWMSYIYGVYPVLEAWSEASITWNDAPTSATAPALEFDGADWQGNWGKWHLIPGFAYLAQSWLDDPGANRGITIRAVSSFYGEPYIYSSDSENADLRPKLVLVTQSVATEGRAWGEVKNLFR